MSIKLIRIEYVAAVVIYGTIGMFLRFISLPSEAAALCRGVIGSIFILIFMRTRGRNPDRQAIRRNLVYLVPSGICLGLNWIFLFAAYIRTTVAIASLCNYMAPLIVIMIAPAVLREKLDKRKLPCVAAAFLGIVLVSNITDGGGNLPGVALGLTAAFCFVGIVLCNRKISGISLYDKAVVQLAVSAVTILPYVIIHNYGKPVEMNLRSVLIILLLGIVHTGAAYCFYFTGLSSLPVQEVAVLGYLEPVVSMICSAVFLHEPMGTGGRIGAVLILAAAVVSELLSETPASE